MKTKFYPIPILLFYLSTLSFSASYAQCGCADGVTASQVTYTVNMPPTASSTIISFPRFDPALGTLSCVVFRDTLTMASTLGIRNLDPVALEYEFMLILGNSVSGPGISINNSGSRPYGPDTLGAFGTLTDSITYGPDTIINHVINARTNSSNLAGYYGTVGTVNFTYSTNGGAVSTGGGTNFSQVIRTQSTGVFSLTYFWCPPEILSGKFRNFKVSRNGDHIGLSWEVDNEDVSNRYEIQASIDGVNFVTIGHVTMNPDGSYSIDMQADAKYSYFRVMQVDAKGARHYSVIRRQQGNGGAQQLSVYPNPASDRLNLLSGGLLKGTYAISLYSSSGHLIMQQNMRVEGTNNIAIPLKTKPAPGVYYLRAANLDNPGEVSSLRVLIK